MDTSQNSIARVLGVTQGAVSKWARGSGHPTLRKVLQIATLTGVSVEWLLTGQGQRKVTKVDSLTEMLLKNWIGLAESDRREVVEFVKFKRAASSGPADDTESGPTGPDKNH